MRKFKFRVWHKYIKTMIYSNDYNCLSQFFESNTYNYYTKNNPKKTYILLQYTGLKDKNNKEIYENDIVKGKTGNKFLIKYSKEIASFVLYSLYSYKEIGILENARYLEIIGNKYENPKLIED